MHKIHKSLIILGRKVNISIEIESKNEKDARKVYDKLKNGDSLSMEELTLLQENDML